MKCLYVNVMQLTGEQRLSLAIELRRRGIMFYGQGAGFARAEYFQLNLYNLSYGTYRFLPPPDAHWLTL